MARRLLYETLPTPAPTGAAPDQLDVGVAIDGRSAARSARLSISVYQPAAGVVVVELEGELDLAHAYVFDVEMTRLAERRPNLVIVDLRELSFMDCSGGARLLALHRRARRSGSRLVVVRGAPVVQRLFALIGLDAELEQVRDPADAARTTSSSRPERGR